MRAVWPGADDQHALLEMRIVREAVEGEPPGQHGHDEHAERGDEGARVEHQRREDDAGEREDDRRGARRLEQTDDQLAVRVDDREVVEIVVVEAQLAQRGDGGDLPQRRGAVEAAVDARRQRHRPRDQHDLEAEDRQAANRYVPIEDLHGSLEAGWDWWSNESAQSLAMSSMARRLVPIVLLLSRVVQDDAEQA